MLYIGEMLFNSYFFIFVFLPIALIGYYTLNRFNKYNLAEYFLIGMSLWFYSYFNISYLPIIVISILLNFFLGRLFLNYNISKKCRIILLIIGLVGNVGVLFYFKYMGFFIQNMNIIFKTNFFITNILLPLGISFFTFQQLSYVVDSYKEIVPKYKFREYALFVTFFPQLIAGPIVLHNETIPQFKNIEKRKFNWDNFATGLMAFSFGMAKKVLIADSFGNIVNWGFNNIGSLASTSAIFVMLSYTIQIYFDFSGYCDMATGIGKMFNIDLPMNFNSPYKALTINDFWKRWHITLTRFLRTYIYFPLGGNRKGTARTYINLFIVFFVSGLWHGANYTFIVWGALHGIAMIFNRLFNDKINRLHPTFLWITTFIFINITWIFFRADSVSDAILFLKQIIYFDFNALPSELVYLFNFDGILFLLNQIGGAIGSYFIATLPVWAMILVVMGILFFKNTNERINMFTSSVTNASISAILLFFSIISLAGISTFLYFNF